MAIFRLRVNIISRAKGQSVIASAAYRSGEKLLDPNRIKDHDYSRKSGIEHTEIMLPANAPDWIKVADKSQEHDVRQDLWSRVEQAERKKNSQLAREVVVALPHELNKEQRLRLVKEFVERNFTSRGMVADVALHEPEPGGNPKNFHAHILLTMRDLTRDGFASHKRRDWNDHALTQEWRRDWADCANRHLERAGRPERIDHRSNKERGIDREPEPKLGPLAHEIEKAGGQSRAGDDIRAVKERNLRRNIEKLGARALDILEQQLDRAQHPLVKELVVSRFERLIEDLDRAKADTGRDGTSQRDDTGTGRSARETREASEGRIKGLEAFQAGLLKIGIEAEQARTNMRDSKQREDDERGRERKGDWWK